MRLYNQMDYLKHPNGIMARLCLRADRIQCVSKATAERFCALLPELKDRCSVVYGGFEPPSRRVRPPDSGEARLVCVGRLDPVIVICPSSLAPAARRGCPIGCP